jgi:hypothetical protein
MAADRIVLHKKAKIHVLRLCKRIEEADSDNEIAVKMARDMAKGAKQYGSLSSKQFAWLCDNARRNDIKLPPELTVLLGKGQGSPKTIGANDSMQLGEVLGTKMLKCLRRIEKMLGERLPAQ